jgi:hypothetical protein
MNRKNEFKNYGSKVNSNYENTALLNKMFEEGIYEEKIECEEDIEKEIHREQLISQLEFNENIIQERNEQIEELFKDVLVINDIFKDLNKMVAEQSEPISKLEEEIDKTLKKTQDGVENIKKAEKYYNSWLSRRNKLILMGIAGLSINIPITLTLGLKAGAISGLSTFGLSAISSLFGK